MKLCYISFYFRLTPQYTFKYKIEHKPNKYNYRCMVPLDFKDTDSISCDYTSPTIDQKKYLIQSTDNSHLVSFCPLIFDPKIKILPI